MAILKKHVKKYNSNITFISHGGILELKKYDWPGNVREMENLLERAVLICENPIITEEDILPLLPKPVQDSIDKPPRTVPENPFINIHNNNDNDDSPIRTLKQLELDAIRDGLNRTNWNMTSTAQQLGISRMTLYRKIDRHGLKKNG